MSNNLTVINVCKIIKGIVDMPLLSDSQKLILIGNAIEKVEDRLNKGEE